MKRRYFAILMRSRYDETVLKMTLMITMHIFQPWIRYIEHKADSPKNILNMIFERALKELPGSYKLWYNYLKVTSTLSI